MTNTKDIILNNKDIDNQPEIIMTDSRAYLKRMHRRQQRIKKQQKRACMTMAVVTFACFLLVFLVSMFVLVKIHPATFSLFLAITIAIIFIEMYIAITIYDYLHKSICKSWK